MSAGRNPQVRFALITGASSGIGAALALGLARPGVRLALCGRREDELIAIAERCRERGSDVITSVFDVTHSGAFEAFVAEAEAVGPLDLLVANAGILDGPQGDDVVEAVATMRRVIEVNLIAALENVHAVLRRMRSRGAGHIVLLSSIAAVSPLPDAPAYSASKAALLNYGLALRHALAGTGISVTTVCPGYVATGMTERHSGPQPFKLDAEEAARQILTAIRQNAEVHGFPGALFRLARLQGFAPEWLRRRITNTLRFRVSSPPG